MDPVALFRPCASLSDAILRGLTLRPTWSVVEVIHQDEYTLDVILQAAPDGPAVVLDCT